MFIYVKDLSDRDILVNVNHIIKVEPTEPSHGDRHYSSLYLTDRVFIMSQDTVSDIQFRAREEAIHLNIK